MTVHVDETSLARLLDDVAAGRATVGEAVDALRALPFEDITDARVDHHRELRTGQAEAIYGPGKSPEQVAEIAAAMVARGGGALFLTRSTPEQADAALAVARGAVWHERARLVVLRGVDPANDAPTIAVVAAGTSDLPVA